MLFSYMLIPDNLFSYELSAKNTVLDSTEYVKNTVLGSQIFYWVPLLDSTIACPKIHGRSYFPVLANNQRLDKQRR